MRPPVLLHGPRGIHSPESVSIHPVCCAPCYHSSTKKLNQQPSTSSMESESVSPSDDDVYDYLAEPNENLICPICRNPFIDPVMCESTDHVFCRVCLIKSLEVSPTCPIDRLPLSLSLVIPAPKIINKLVDELLVSCPFKSKLGCPFVCQRDLIAAHLRSHQAQIDHPDFGSSPVSQGQDPPLSKETFAQRPSLDQHPSTTSNHQLRFQWVSGRATLIANSQDQNSTSLAQMTSTATTAKNEPELSHCPFERFGCSFVGTPEVINHQHLPAVSDSAVLSDDSRCPFLSVREILNWFEHLEARNIALKEELTQSLVQRSELASVLDSLKASFRQLWLSQESGDHRIPLMNPPTHHHPLPFAPGPLASVFSHPEYPEELPSSRQSNRSPVGLSLPDPSSPTRRSSDSFLHMNSSRMNYDSLNGHRLKHFDHYPPACPAQFYCALGSPSSSKMKIRVSTFLRRGEVVTPATESFEHTQSLGESLVEPQSHQPTCISSQAEEPTNSPTPTLLPEQTIRSDSLFPTFNIQSVNDHHREISNNRYDQYHQLSKQDSIRQAALLSKTSSQTPQSESTNEHTGLLSRKIGELTEAIQSSLRAWHPHGPIILPSDLGVTDQPVAAEGRAANGRVVTDSTTTDRADGPDRMGSSDHHSVLSSLEKIEKLMGNLIEQGLTSHASKESLLEDLSNRASELSLKSSPSSSSSSSSSSSAPPPSSIHSLKRHPPSSSSRSQSTRFSEDFPTNSGPSYCSASSCSSSIRPMKL
ncbi:uncharacterized protein PGTG_00556 [Puccinia graminis f. sp. tritici CRL 75-36-700-3]|uniref:RING-type domain-containing protein n=1 Tax=Puccinia graminis f. sp. tritici (strain CRL 75-36-700-3 / race SCCL) TaxID=418459 RepID=E3JRD6_PUCGT|nr:uncharacterized protein PGTG_00556 [Puccinia graminis f. sp. tritici CRL 75-36-700-3]EFP74600.2 hypothetical protein PGTG_00556 [Puccinia graminis f. sp. tritici CRL 75-36-700-3]